MSSSYFLYSYTNRDHFLIWGELHLITVSVAKIFFPNYLAIEYFPASP